MLVHLPHRGVISVRGDDRVSFLNGLVSNDVAKAAHGLAVWAAMLTPQGRYFTDFFVLFDEERLLLDVQRADIPELLKRLTRFKLRADVQLEDLSETLHVHASWGGMPPEVPLTAPDPRLPEAGYRLLSEAALTGDGPAATYTAHRITLGLPDGPPDLEPEKTLLLEAGFDELNGVDWQKGCYMGQELTARTKYRGLVKRRLLPVSLESSAPPPGTPILAEGAEVGTIRSAAGALALAMLRTDALNKPLIAGSSLVTPLPPAWMKLPA
jgi:folate-binding protein YgfZ